MSSGIVWTRSPSDLAGDFVKYGKRVEAALYAAANAWGQFIQDEGRGNAPWTDRTANARSGIFFAVDGPNANLMTGQMIGDISPGAKEQMKEVEEVRANGNEIIIVLSHTVFYGKYLELSRGGKYAIIMSTIEGNIPALETLIRKAYGSA